MSGDWVLLGDIGGTNARFAVARGREIAQTANFDVAAHATPLDAIASFLKNQPPGRRPGTAALACAGPPEDGVVAMVNSSWRIDAREIEDVFGFAQVVLVNDFEALAWAVPCFEASMLHPLGGGQARAKFPAVILGPGTGLGMAAYLPLPQGPAVIFGEGGHATLPAASDAQAALLAHCRAELGHVSAERLLSGAGLEQLYRSLAAVEGREVPARGAAGITAAAKSGTCPHCQETLGHFCALLGNFAGNCALTFGAQGGVYIAGGIAPRILEFLSGSGFRQAFEAKGRFKSYLAAIPTWVVTHPRPAFLGLLQLLDTKPA